MQAVNLVVILYSILSIALGIVGGLGLAGGKPSPMSYAGVVVGALVLGTVALAKTHPRAGRIGSAVLTLLMLGNFAPKFFKTGDWLPAGVMAVASLVTLLVLVGGHFKAMSDKKKGVA